LKVSISSRPQYPRIKNGGGALAEGGGGKIFMIQKRGCLMGMLVLVGVLGMLVSGCGLQWQTKEDAPVGNYKKVHHTITFETEPLCVGSCNPQAKSW